MFSLFTPNNDGLDTMLTLGDSTEIIELFFWMLSSSSDFDSMLRIMNSHSSCPPREFQIYSSVFNYNISKLDIMF